MNLIAHILVPVDFGDASANAVALAGRIADGCGAAMTLLHAERVEAPAYFTREQLEGLSRERAQRQEQALQYLERFGRRHTRTTFTPRVVMRAAIDAIEAEAAGADLVVIGTHARRGPQRWWLGSVTERVLRDLTTPVLVTHPGDHGELPRSLAVYTAPSLSGRSALALAMRLGQAMGAEVHDRRNQAIDVDSAFADASMVVMAEPWVHDREWRTRVGEPLIRAGKGPVLFVPER